MPLHLALLRAVNVGGTGKLKMADLRDLLTGLGARDVRTLLASGNAIFRHNDAVSAVKALLEDALSCHMGGSVGVLMRDRPAIDRALADNPFPDVDPGRLGLLFTDDAIPKVPAAEARGQTDEQIAPGPGLVYVHYPSGMGRSRLRLPQLARGTMRNLNTVRKLHDLLRDDQ